MVVISFPEAGSQEGERGSGRRGHSCEAKGLSVMKEKAGSVAASEEWFIPVSKTGATTRIIGNAKAPWGEAQL